MKFQDVVGFFVSVLTAPTLCSTSRNYSRLICKPGTTYCSSEIGKDSNDTTSIHTCNKQGNNWTSSYCSFRHDSCVTFPFRFNAECLRKCTPRNIYCSRTLDSMGYDKVYDLQPNSLYTCKDVNKLKFFRSCLGSCVPSKGDSVCLQGCEPGLDYCGHELNSLEGWGKNYFPHSLYHCNLDKSIILKRNCTKICEASRKDSFCGFISYFDACDSSPILSRVKRVQDGTEAKPGEWPWMASLRFNGDHFCGGALIGSSWILTAAHCLKGQLVVDIETVLGNISPHRYAKGELRLKADKMHIHEGYDKDTLKNDIALIHLTTPVAPSLFIRPLCLSDFQEKNTQNCMIVGWGETKSSSLFPVLQEGKISIMTTKECGDHYMNEVKKSSINISEFICAGERDAFHTGSCEGDSGGPLMCQDEKGNWQGVGVTSWSSIFACSSVANILPLPGGYTRIFFYSNWIENITSIKTLSNMNSISIGSLLISDINFVFFFLVSLAMGK